jgi:hypothetical protein
MHAIPSISIHDTAKGGRGREGTHEPTEETSGIAMAASLLLKEDAVFQ